MSGRALFLDRDGVINDLILNPANGEFESPHTVEEFKFAEGAVEAVLKLSSMFDYIFVVSNQPSFAKHKTTMAQLKAIHQKMIDGFLRHRFQFTDCFYCFHHPDGLEPVLRGSCECRKPSPFFLIEAIRKFSLTTDACWMVGDQDTDIDCGKRAGVRTIALLNPLSAKKRQKIDADFSCETLAEVPLLLAEILHREDPTL
jgi:D-glycero-D-manno-heptose 1,7-bisphosphate phosphatase